MRNSAQAVASPSGLPARRHLYRELLRVRALLAHNRFALSSKGLFGHLRLSKMSSRCCALYEVRPHLRNRLGRADDSDVLESASIERRIHQPDDADHCSVWWDLDEEAYRISIKRTVGHRDAIQESDYSRPHNERIFERPVADYRVHTGLINETDYLHLPRLSLDELSVCQQIAFNKRQNRIAEQPYAAKGNARARLSACRSRASIARPA
jgi:hypothetical protein